MKRSTDRIFTTHVGSLPRPKAKKGRGAWTFGSKERKEFAEFYAAEASAAATTSQGGTSNTASPAPLLVHREPPVVDVETG